MLRRLVFLALPILVPAAPAAAQFTQYTPPGALASTTEATAEQAKKSAERARWKLGKIALDPRLTLRDVGYYRNAFAAPGETDEIDDYRASLGAGLAAYLKVGSKSVASAFLVPEYSWWRDQDELSQLNINWGAGWFGYFNRLTVTANAGVIERERPLSDEVEAPLTIERLRQEVRLDLELTDYLTIFADASAEELRHTNEVDPFVPGLVADRLDRDSEAVSSGAILTVRRWRFGLGIESSDVEFLSDPTGRSNSGDSPFAQLGYDGERIDLTVNWFDRDIDFDGPDLARESLTDGNALVQLELSPTARLSLYGARTLAFSTLDADGYIVNTRQGASLELDLGRRLGLSLFAEQGAADFRGPSAGSRNDDLEAAGARLLWQLKEGLGLGVYLRESAWDSNLDEFDRSQDALGVSLEFGEDLFPW